MQNGVVQGPNKKISHFVSTHDLNSKPFIGITRVLAERFDEYQLTVRPIGLCACLQPNLLRGKGAIALFEKQCTGWSGFCAHDCTTLVWLTIVCCQLSHNM